MRLPIPPQRLTYNAKRGRCARRVFAFLEAPPGIGPGIKALQASALPLGYGAVKGGGNNRARTCDPLLVRQMLSQLSYAPNRTL